MVLVHVVENRLVCGRFGFLRGLRSTDEKMLSVRFGLIIGGMWMGLFVLGNLGGTSVFGNLRELHPGIYGLSGYFAIGAIFAIAFAGLTAAHRTGSIPVALSVGARSGLISGAMCLITVMGITVLFHDAMMRDPANIHEFTRGARRLPTQAELSSFLYWDALAGGLNMLWIGPLLGLTVGAFGAAFGKLMRRDDLQRARSR